MEIFCKMAVRREFFFKKVGKNFHVCVDKTLFYDLYGDLLTFILNRYPHHWKVGFADCVYDVCEFRFGCAITEKSFNANHDNQVQRVNMWLPDTVGLRAGSQAVYSHFLIVYITLSVLKILYILL